MCSMMSLLQAFRHRNCWLRITRCVYNTCSRNVQIKTDTNIMVPDKVNSTVIEKWKRYWKDLMRDYGDVLKETVDNAKKYPKKTMMVCSCIGLALMCFKTNPDERVYRESVIKYSNNVMLVAKPVRNQSVDKFLTSVETCYNLGILRRLSFGILSIMWVDNYSNELGLFKTSCSYLKPQYLTFFNRIIDVGFFGKWWRLDMMMVDYDVNLEEWIDTDKQSLQVK